MMIYRFKYRSYYTYNFTVVFDDHNEACWICVEDAFQVRFLHIPLVLCGQVIQTLYVTASHWSYCIVDVFIFASANKRKTNTGELTSNRIRKVRTTTQQCRCNVDVDATLYNPAGIIKLALTSLTMSILYKCSNLSFDEMHEIVVTYITVQKSNLYTVGFVILNSKGLSLILLDIRCSIYQICRTKKKK